MNVEFGLLTLMLLMSRCNELATLQSQSLMCRANNVEYSTFYLGRDFNALIKMN